jgi:tetratricopeptide (TPR) repeat protein
MSDIENQTIYGGNQQFAETINNLYYSADYKKLLNDKETALLLFKKHSDDLELWQRLEIAQQKLEDFKRDVLKLAEDFNKIPINTERLRLAKQYFDAGDYHDARTILDAENIVNDQNALLAKQQRLQNEQDEITTQLGDNANEFLLKAHLTAIDYRLPNRIDQASQFFELALKSARTAENIFAYACFLQENNQFLAAEQLYTEALGIYQQLAQDNPDEFLFCVATVLNNLGNLVSADSNRRSKAEQLYTKALGIYQQIAQVNPKFFLFYVATTLNNLGNLVAADSNRRSEAEQIYTEVLEIRRLLAKANPDVFLPNMAGTLNNLGTLVAADSNRSNEAEQHFTEALGIYQQLVEVYLPDVAMTLNNLGIVVAADSNRSNEAEQHFIEALRIYKQLAQTNPEVYFPNVTGVINNLHNLLKDRKVP